MPVVGRNEFALLADLRRAGKATVLLPEDRAIVERHSTRPLRLLSQMAHKGLLRRVQKGRYVVLGPGAGALRDEVPAFAIVDAAFASVGYAISFLSALTYYGLTDHEPYEVTILADLPQGARPPRQIADVALRVRAERRAGRWFGVRTQEDNFGSFRIADPERAMIDSLDRPELSGGAETVVRALARGLLNGTLRVPRLVRYADRHSVRLARRVGFLLELLEAADPAQLQPLRDRAKRTRRVESLFGVDDGGEDIQKSAAWRLRIEVPAPVIRAWAAYEEAV